MFHNPRLPNYRASKKPLYAASMELQAKVRLLFHAKRDAIKSAFDITLSHGEPSLPECARVLRALAEPGSIVQRHSTDDYAVQQNRAALNAARELMSHVRKLAPGILSH